MHAPVYYVVQAGQVLDRLIHDYGEYMFMGVALLGLAAIAWIIVHGLRRPPPPPPDAAEAKRGAIIGIMLASGDNAPTADGGRTDLIWGKPVHSEPRDPDRS